MLRARTVTGLATVDLGSVFSFRDVVPVAGLLKIVEDLFVAHLAGIGAHVGGRGRLLRLFGQIAGSDLRTRGYRDEKHRN